MGRKKKEEAPEVIIKKKEAAKINPYGWMAIVNKAKFTKPK